MEIKILFDSKGLNRTFRIGWGGSYLINGQVLFDTGERSSYLFRNMGHMGINISDIKRSSFLTTTGTIQTGYGISSVKGPDLIFTCVPGSVRNSGINSQNINVTS
jgi:hypothetical protein